MGAQCIRCGGSPHHDYAVGCEHDSGEAPEPRDVRLVRDDRDEARRHPVASREWVYEAQGWANRGMLWLAVRHPLRDGAIALWKERYTWGRAVQGTFLTLTRWAKEGQRAREEREHSPVRVEWEPVDGAPTGSYPRCTFVAIADGPLEAGQAVSVKDGWVSPLAEALKDTQRFGQ